MRFYPTILGALVIGLLPLSAIAADAPKAAPTVSDAERTKIEGVVRDFLTQKEPEVVMKAVQEVQRRNEAENNKKIQKSVEENKDKLFNDPSSPFVGNAKGDVTIVEFFDYQCGHCKKVGEGISKLISEDKNVKVVYKDFPILGSGSLIGAKAALAAAKQGKYEKLHAALLNSKERISDEVVEKIAKEAGLDAVKLKKDMADPEIEKALQANLELGASIGVRGTPMFFIGSEVYPGAMTLEQMKEAVAEARKSTKK